MYKKEDKERFADILRRKNFNVSKACQAVGISRSTFYEWMQEEDFAALIEELKEEDIDDAEETLRMLRKGVPKRDEDGNITGWIVAPQLTATIFYLKTQGKSRGYVESTELDVTTKKVDGPSWFEEVLEREGEPKKNGLLE